MAPNNLDSQSVSGRKMPAGYSSSGTSSPVEWRNKYNTLTPAEAKKLNNFLGSTRRQPNRTASVLYKPRPPSSIMSTNLDSIGPRKGANNPMGQLANANGLPQVQPFNAFQNQISNLKRFFRNMPLRKTFSVTNTSTIGRQSDKNNTDNSNRDNDKQTFNHSVSQLFLNRSQSPPVCPPPLGELKSMYHIESQSVNYSNYDEFTRTRNEKSNCQASNRSNHRESDSRTLQTDGCHDNEWQLTSLPVSYERNLSTVFEERSNQIFVPNLIRHVARDDCVKSLGKGRLIAGVVNGQSGFIKPPDCFEDSQRRQMNNMNQNNSDSSFNSPSNSDSSHSLASTTTADSVLDYHRLAAANPFRFSFAQTPGVGVDKVKIQVAKQQVAQETERTRDKIDTCDLAALRQPKDALDHYSFSTNLNPQNPYQSCESKAQASNGAPVSGLPPRVSNSASNQTPAESRDVNAVAYINKCAELERIVESLKDKLLCKEKEITELQLEQINSDYLIEQLKKENSHLKALASQQQQQQQQQQLQLQQHYHNQQHQAKGTEMHIDNSCFAFARSPGCAGVVTRES